VETSELTAFIAVRATGVTLIAHGISPRSFAAIASALSRLYLPWKY